MQAHAASDRPARIFFAALAALLALALCVRIGIAVTNDDATLGVRLMRLFSYFTIQSNILVCACAVALARDPREDRPGWRIARLDSLAGIVVTGLVYFIILRPDDHQTGLGVYTNIVFHYISPVATVAGWLAFGPWPGRAWNDIGRAFVWPAVWVAYTLVHGAVSEWYPYGFINVVEKGYGRVAVNIAVIALFIAALLAMFTALDRRWHRRRAPGRRASA